MKLCKRCGISKYIDKFEHGRAKCKICRNTQNAEFYQKNKIKICLDKKEYRKNKKEVIAIKAKSTYKKNRDSILINKKSYYHSNRIHVLDRLSKYYESNRDRIRATKAKYCKNNANKISCRNAKRRATLLNACPVWLSNKHARRIEAFYRLARYLTNKTNTPYEVDHIVPLKGKDINGLHVPWNLQILTRRKNRQKGNKTNG